MSRRPRLTFPEASRHRQRGNNPFACVSSGEENKCVPFFQRRMENMMKNKRSSFFRKIALDLCLLASIFLLSACDGNVDFEVVSGDVVTELAIPKEYTRSYKGEVSSMFTIPYRDMPRVGEYAIPGEKGEWHLLNIRGGTTMGKQRKTRLSLIKTMRYEEIVSDVPGYTRYGPDNYQQLGGVSFFYVSPDQAVLCAANCRYYGIYSEHLSFDYSFPKSELVNLNKVDASVKALISQFIENAKH